MFMVNKA